MSYFSKRGLTALRLAKTDLDKFAYDKVEKSDLRKIPVILDTIEGNLKIADAEGLRGATGLEWERLREFKRGLKEAIE